MKNLFSNCILSLVLLTGNNLLGQTPSNTEGVSISSTVTPPHPSAMLHVESDNKGILIPRISLNSITDVSTIENPTESLLLYNTNPSIINGCGKGFYYWNNSRWEKLGKTCIPHMTFAEMIAFTASLGPDDIGFQVYVTDNNINPTLIVPNASCTGSVNVHGIWTFQNQPLGCQYSCRYSSIKWFRDAGISWPCSEPTCEC